MGRELQKKKNRSSISKSRPKLSNSKRTKTGRRKVDFGNNEILSNNWNRKETLSQNYARLGLSSKLVAPAGGVERHSRSNTKLSSTVTPNDSLAIPTARHTEKLALHEEVRVVRDPATGKILQVVRNGGDGDEDEDMLDNPLNDPLVDLEARPTPTVKAATDVVAALEREAAEEEATMARKKQPRKQSHREEEWIAKLVEKYGDDVPKMVRDRRLNPMQQSEGDLKRRIRQWKKSHGD